MSTEGSSHVGGEVKKKILYKAMSGSPNDGFLEADKNTIRKVFLKTAIRSIFYTILWVPVYIIRSLLVRFVGKYKPTYGKILDSCDSTLEEDFVNNRPKCALVFTLVLDGSIELQKLRHLFTNNVLDAKIADKKTGKDKLRYPEFRQYQTDFAGFKFWKKDELFNISNHITEERYAKQHMSNSKIHQDQHNKPFPKKRSPWELVLVNNYRNEEDKSLLIFRNHHTLGDTKSQLKMLVECLGQKNLKLPNVQYPSSSLLEKFHFYAWLPYYFVFTQVVGYFTALKADKTPWKFSGDEEPPVNLAISKPISMNDIKLIAKKHNVTSSAVIMAAVAGGAAKGDKRLARNSIPNHWVLPKPDHPAIMANHNYAAIMHLPTDVSSPLQRLKKCNEIFQKLKSSTLHKYDKAVVFQLGTWFNPLRVNFLKNGAIPLIVTNIAGEGEGFEVDSSQCSEFSMSAAPGVGVCGAIITGFSYKDNIEISITAKDGILTGAQTFRVTSAIEKEFEILKKASA